MELAQERDEDIPALVYEARSTGQPRRLHRPQQQRQQHSNRYDQRQDRQQEGNSPEALLQEVTVAQASSPSPEKQLQPNSSESVRPIQPQPSG